MTRSICDSWLLCGFLVLAATGCLTIVSSYFGGDRVVAGQTQPKAGATKRSKSGPRKKQKSKPKLRRKGYSDKNAPPNKLAVPKPETLLALIRLHLVALDQAIKANDFRVLHAISAPGLQSKMTAGRLATAFASLRARRTDLAAAVIITPQITESPKILPGNVLNIVGHLPTKRQRIDFHMQFQPADRQWKLLGMNVSAKPVKRAKPRAVAPAKKAAQSDRKRRPRPRRTPQQQRNK